MIYIFTLIVILFLVFIYEIDGTYGNKSKKQLYLLLYIWLAALSGFAYNVGSDIPGYMREYAFISSNSSNSLFALPKLENRLPGWIMLNVLCAKISTQFVVLKLVIAFFVNGVYFLFIRRHTKYIFLAILLYYVTLYANLNFNALRQSIAMAFFLLGYEYLLKKKWMKYYIYVFLASMFHSTGLMCVIFPLLYFLKFNKNTLAVTILAILAFAIFTLQSGDNSLINELFLNSSDVLGDITDRDRFVDAYFGEDAKKFSALNIFGIIQALLITIPVILVLIASRKNVITISRVTEGFMVLYLIIFLLDSVVPVVFFRLMMYFQIVFFCVFSSLIIESSKKKFLPKVAILFLFCLAVYRPVISLFITNQFTGLPLYIQYSPYYSIFDPQIDPIRAANFGYFDEN